MKVQMPVMGMDRSIERFAALDQLPGIQHAFVGRISGVDVQADRAIALERLNESHEHARRRLGMDGQQFVTAEQIHGKVVAVFAESGALPPLPVAGVDALVTNRTDLCLGIYVADCCPVYFVDAVRRVIGLAHSGKKGTEQNITLATLEAMAKRFGTHLGDVTAQLGPCIRPPWYEVDIAAQIVEQCRAARVGQVHDCGTCTATNPEQYYSYRREKGRTGRMLALLALR